MNVSPYWNSDCLSCRSAYPYSISSTELFGSRVNYLILAVQTSPPPRILEVLQRAPEDGQSALFLLVVAGELLPEHRERSIASFVWMSPNLAPSAGNLQSYEIYAINNAEKKPALSHASGDQ